MPREALVSPVYTVSMLRLLVALLCVYIVDQFKTVAILGFVFEEQDYSRNSWKLSLKDWSLQKMSQFFLISMAIVRV